MTGEQTGWGHAIGAFERANPGWLIESDGARYSARRKVSGRARGPKMIGRTLDELGDKITAAEEGRKPRDT